MTHPSQNAANGPPDALAAARTAVSGYLDRQVAVGTSGAADQLSRWQVTGTTDEHIAEATAQAAWDQVGDKPSGLYVTGLEDLRKEYARLWHEADLVTRGLQQLGHDVAGLDIPHPPDDEGA
ncbi:hypothetical protein G3I60_03385 [Streptomyces sp. SID13666]|uniref:hypothetical protein n=1 Tax=unclassified Streptomyces TaxID=2593676 RepID=UPI0013C08563|nr:MULTISPECIES: hypothetical protein [unclassified Streptomyces]NEA53237.1 hypothetical protein [Streptomyces sp. SID13666]NEA69436.1 hypothetical protein [Streptomyces sp. SID13588]